MVRKQAAPGAGARGSGENVQLPAEQPPDDTASAEDREGALAKAHASRMFFWEDQLVRDYGMSNFGVRFGVAIRKKVDAATGYASVSDVYYAKMLGTWREPPADRKTKFYEDGTRIVRRTKMELVERGHLHKGPGKRLTPVIHEKPEANANPDSGARVSTPENRTPEPGFQVEEVQVAPGKTGPLSPETRTPESQNPGSGVPVLHLSESSSESAVVLPPESDSDSKRGKKRSQKVRVEDRHERDARALLNVAAGKSKLYLLHRWTAELAQLEREGLPADFVLAAAWKIAIDDRMPQDVGTPRYFEPAARDLKIQAATRGDEWWWDQLGDLQYRFNSRSWASPAVTPAH